MIYQEKCLETEHKLEKAELREGMAIVKSD